jgi:hypothetical protein
LNADKPSRNFWVGNGILEVVMLTLFFMGAAIERAWHPGDGAEDGAGRLGHGAGDVVHARRTA